MKLSSPPFLHPSTSREEALQSPSFRPGSEERAATSLKCPAGKGGAQHGVSLLTELGGFGAGEGDSIRRA